jgi:hypothetical protein
VAIPATGEQGAGFHQVTVDCTHLPSGVYFYQLKAGSWRETKKFVLTK